MPGGKRVSGERGLGLLLVLGATSCFAVIGITVKPALDIGASTFGITALRLILAAVIATAISTPRRVGRLLLTREARWFVLAGVTGGAVGGSAEVAAYRQMPVATVVFILWLAPTWISLFEWLVRGKRPTALAAASLALQVLGLYLLIGGSPQGLSPGGILLAATGSVCTAVLFLAIERGTAQVDTIGGVAVLSISASAAVLPAALLLGDIGRQVTDTQLLGFVLILGLVPTLGGFVLLFEGLRRARAMEGAIVAATEPFLAAALAWMVYDETLARLQVVGGFLIVLSALLVSRSTTLTDKSAAS